MTNYFVVMNIRQETLILIKKDFYSCIKNSAYKFVVKYEDMSYNCFQALVSIIDELKDTINFTIFGSYMDKK